MEILFSLNATYWESEIHVSNCKEEHCQNTMVILQECPYYTVQEDNSFLPGPMEIFTVYKNRVC